MRKLIIAFAALAIAGGAFAFEVAGVKLDDKATVAGQELVLNGAGLRTKVVFKVYVASLYLPAKTASVAAILDGGSRRIQINLLRDVSADEFVGALVDGMKANNSPAEFAAIKAETDQFIAIMKGAGAVKEKDVVTLDFVGGATNVGLNGAAKGTVPGAAFNRALTKIWLGDQPVQADLKKAMLGG
jgi:long-chain acyl-CoA synthetase